MHGGAGFWRVRAELMAFVVRLGVVDGDEVRAIGRGQAQQGDGIVDAGLLDGWGGLGLVVELRVPGRPEAGDLRFGAGPEEAGGAHALAFGKTPQGRAAIPGAVCNGLGIGDAVAGLASGSRKLLATRPWCSG